MIVPILQYLFEHWLSVAGFIFLGYFINNRYHNGLNKYPGPFLASVTDWWRFWIVYKKRPEVKHIELHQKHGDVVRLGPNNISFANPAALKAIYGLNKGFTKVDDPLRYGTISSLTKHSQSSIQFNKLSQRVIDYHHYSVQPRMLSIPNYDAVSTVLFQ